MGVDFNIKKQFTNFSLKRKPLASSYNTIKDVRSWFNKSSTGDSAGFTDLTAFSNGDDLDPYFQNNTTNNIESCIKISNTLYSTNRIYQNILDYYSTMYYNRYMIVPRKVKPSVTSTKAEYQKIYTEMLEFGEGLSIETVFPRLLLDIFKDGRVYLYTSVDKKAKTLLTTELPSKYCRPTVTTQFNTQQFDFDFSFFDSFGLTGDDLVALLELFPEEFQEKYVQYTLNKSKNRWQHLDPKYSTCIALNRDGFPSFLSVFYDIIDYKTYKLNELDRSTNTLERLVTQEIDLESSGLDMDEISALHDSMASVICANKGTTLVTSPGKLDVKQLQDDIGQENETLSKTFQSIYDNAGLNHELFTGDSADALNASIKQDEAFVWVYIQKLVNFYNIAINNCKKFGNYQLSLRILPITVFNEDEKLNQLHQGATYGVGKLDYIVGIGSKQIDIDAQIDLEEYLNLSERLVPLQSSHTQSSTVGEDEKKEDSDSKEDKESSKEDSSKSNDEEEDSVNKNKEEKVVEDEE